MNNKVHINLNNKTILVTGSPGFIGANLVLRLLKEMNAGTIISFDSMNDYYDPKLKEYRLNLIEEAAKKSNVNHIFIHGNLADKTLIDNVFNKYQPAIVVNLAAQAGGRYSIDHPDMYIEANIIGFYNILEACRHSYDNNQKGVEHLVYASSSSVYGGNKKVPFSIEDKVDNPVSLYAATKKATSCWLIAIPSCITSPPRVCGSSPCTVLPAVQTCSTSPPPRSWPQAKPSKSSTTANASGILPTLMTS